MLGGRLPPPGADRSRDRIPCRLMPPATPTSSARIRELYPLRNNKPAMRMSVVLLLDILGYKEMSAKGR